MTRRQRISILSITTRVISVLPNYIDKQSEILTGLDGDVWYDYYRKVAINPSRVRKACHAKMKISASHSKAIVIVHGIADSPFSQADIANIFF